jgi:hypothetical protein
MSSCKLGKQEPLLHHLPDAQETSDALGIREISLHRRPTHFLWDPNINYLGGPNELRAFMRKISKELEAEIQETGGVIAAKELQRGLTEADLGWFILRSPSLIWVCGLGTFSRLSGHNFAELGTLARLRVLPYPDFYPFSSFACRDSLLFVLLSSVLWCDPPLGSGVDFEPSPGGKRVVYQEKLVLIPGECRISDGLPFPRVS